MQNFKVIQSNPNSKGGFVTKLQCETTINHPIFGLKSKKETYYISGSKQLDAGVEISLDVNKEFKVSEYPFHSEETGETIQLKWLHLK